jgi:hypothetical protein
VQDLRSSHLALTVLTLNQVLWLKFLRFTGSPIHPPPLGALTHIYLFAPILSDTTQTSLL